MNIVFMGTPDFAVPSLQRMIKEYNVTAILTQPDKPRVEERKWRTLQLKKKD